MRESCAQTLGAVMHHMNTDSVRKVLSVLLKLQEQTHWQVRHGGLLGVKYMLAVKNVSTVLHTCIRGRLMEKVVDQISGIRKCS